MNTKTIKQPTKRTFQQEGKWVVRPTKSVINDCFCGNKYIKTRKDQKSCVRCINKI